MHAIVTPPSPGPRRRALLMASLFGAFPFLIKLYADGGYQGPEFQSAVKRILARVNVEIVKRSDQATGFVALPKRWIVERTSLGSAAADDWPKTGNVSTTRLSPSCASPPSASCCENYAIPHDVLGQTLRPIGSSTHCQSGRSAYCRFHLLCPVRLSGKSKPPKVGNPTRRCGRCNLP